MRHSFKKNHAIVGHLHGDSAVVWPLRCRIGASVHVICSIAADADDDHGATEGGVGEIGFSVETSFGEPTRGSSRSAPSTCATMMEAEEEPQEQEPAVVAVTDDELQPKRTTSFAARYKNKKKPGPPQGNDLIARITLEREKTKYWARLLLLFPLGPVIIALTTIVFGGVVINVATNKCNSMLMEFLQGAVVLSHLLVLFYAYCWMGPRPIKRLRTVRIFYMVFGFISLIWWGIFALYLMAQYEAGVFWISFIIFVGFVVMEKTAKKREAKLNEIKEKQLNALRAKRKAEAEAREESLKAEMEQARREQEAEKKRLAAEQDQLFRDSEGDDTDAANNQLDNDALDDDGENLDDLLMETGDEGAMEDDDDEEVVVVGNDKKSV